MSLQITPLQVALETDLSSQPDRKEASPASTKSTQVYAETIENPSNSQKTEENEKKIYTFPPTEEAWGKKPEKFSWVFKKAIYRPMIFTALVSFVKPKVTEKGWHLLESLDLDTFKTVGDIEKFGIKMLQQEMKSTEERKEEVHKKLKLTLKTYAEVGVVKALTTIVDLMKNP